MKGSLLERTVGKDDSIKHQMLEEQHRLRDGRFWEQQSGAPPRLQSSLPPTGPGPKGSRGAPGGFSWIVVCDRGCFLWHVTLLGEDIVL